MDNRISQYAYTRLGNQESGAGWQFIPLTSNADFAKGELFASMQDKNIANGLLTDEEGEPLVVYDINGSKEDIFVTRVQYGVKDDRANNLFAHGYCIPAGLSHNPNNIVGISESSFLKSYPDSGKSDVNLAYDREYTIESALECCGLDKERYKEFLLCLYASIDAKVPLVIVTKNPASIIWPIAYLAYNGVVFKFRKNLSFTTSELKSTLDKTIILKKTVSGVDKYFYLDSGKNNVFEDDRSRRKYEKKEYITAAAECDDIFELEEYYSELEKIACNLKSDNEVDINTLGIAYKIYEFREEDLDDIELSIYEALTYRNQTDYLDEYISELITSAMKAKLIFSDSINELLVDRYETTSVAILKNSIINYLVELIISGESDIISISYFEDDEFRKEIINNLAKSSDGINVLIEYFSSSIEEIDNIDSLIKIYQEYDINGLGTKIIDKFEGKAFEITCKGIDEKQDIIQIVEKYKEFVEINSNASNIEQVVDSVKCYYWETKELTDFSYQNKKEYLYMLTDSSLKSEAFEGVIKAFDCVIDNKDNNFSKLFNFLLVNYREYFSEDAKNNVWNDFLEMINDNGLKIDQYQYNFYKLAIVYGYTDTKNSCKEMIIALKNNKLEEFGELYEETISCLNNLNDSTEGIALFNKLLFKAYTRYTGESALPLDIMIIIGKIIYPDTIFNVLEDEIWGYVDLDKDELKNMALQSELLSDSDIYLCAKEYSRSRSEFSSVVKHWLKTKDSLSKKDRHNRIDSVSDDFDALDTKIEPEPESHIMKGLFGRFKR